VSGDAAVVSPAEDAFLLAVIDVLGLGPEAAATADSAFSALRAFVGEDVTATIERCHERLRGTRGAAISAARYAPATATLAWVGVGNVQGVLLRGGTHLRPSETLRLLAGTVGHELPGLRAASLRIRRGDVLLLATDGVDPGFADRPDTSGSPQQVVDRILDRHARETDDALVLGVRLLGADA
jgi:serine phosphatase RsbU (regulator of sigma subunit)